MRNIKLILEYDGTNFHGWQQQPNKRTVQGELKKSLKTILDEDINIIGSGRTDAGVHALGQVANFFCSSNITLYRLKAALNGTLPKDVRIITTNDVPERFNARFDAKKREYKYVIAKYEKAIARWYTWYFKKEIDVEAIRKCSQYLIGDHNFKSFCQSKSKDNHYRCVVESVDWIETMDLITFNIVANRFLHNMVRIIVGTMIKIGLGKLPPTELKEIIEIKDRKKAGPTVPAKGLCLVKVYY